MREQLSTVMMTAVVFAGGLLIGAWIERSKPLPPPVPVMGEFQDLRARMVQSSPSWFGFHSPHLSRAPLRWTPGLTPDDVQHRLAVLRPQIRAYRGKVEVIEGQFRGQFEAILNPEQRQELAAVDSGVGSDAPPSFIAIIMYRPALEHFSQVLKLDAQQQKELEALMLARRRELLALIDRDPPPSLRLGAVLPGSPKAPQPNS